MSEPDSELSAAVRAAPIFSAVGQASVDALLAQCATRKFRAGEMIFTAGATADRFFVVLAGRVKVFQLSPRGDEQILHLFAPGDAMGEAAMFAGGTFPAHAQAVEDCRLLVVWRDCLLRAIRDDAELAVGMMAGLSAKLREFASLIETLSLRDVPARVAVALLDQARRAGASSFRLGRTKRSLAAQLGTTPETLSRSLAKFRAAGFIRVQGAQVTILNADALRHAVHSGE